MKTLKVLECIIDVTIGNGAGTFRFVSNRNYTDRDVASAFLSRAQIKTYFREKILNLENNVVRTK